LFFQSTDEDSTDADEYQAIEYGDLPERENKKFATTALGDIVPVLLQLLTQQEEDADEDEWNISMSAGTCLALLAQAVDDAIVPVVLPFIETNIKNEDWHLREAAVMVFGSILEGPDPNVLAGLVGQALPIIIGMMQDPNAAVKDTTAWTLGRICELLVGSVNIESQLQALIVALVAGLEDRPRIVANSCWALMSLAEQLAPELGPDQQPAASATLSPYFQGIVDKLLAVTERYVVHCPFHMGSADFSPSDLQTNPTSAQLHTKLSTHIFPIQRRTHLEQFRMSLLLCFSAWKHS
jgi:importin subunit beta-1